MGPERARFVADDTLASRLLKDYSMCVLVHVHPFEPNLARAPGQSSQSGSFDVVRTSFGIQLVCACSHARLSQLLSFSLHFLRGVTLRICSSLLLWIIASQYRMMLRDGVCRHALSQTLNSYDRGMSCTPCDSESPAVLCHFAPTRFHVDASGDTKQASGMQACLLDCLIPFGAHCEKFGLCEFRLSVMGIACFHGATALVFAFVCRRVLGDVWLATWERSPLRLPRCSRPVRVARGGSTDARARAR